MARRSARSSVILQGLVPGRQAGDDVKLSEKRAHDLVRVVFRAEVLELIEHEGDRPVGVRDGAFREVLALPFEAGAVLQKFLAVEVGQENRCARNPNRADKACCHATPRLGHIRMDRSSLDGPPGNCQRIVIAQRTPLATTNPPRHPSAMPPTTSRSSSWVGTNATPVRPTASAII